MPAFLPVKPGEIQTPPTQRGGGALQPAKPAASRRAGLARLKHSG
jgi:hypothetical protein